MTRFQYTYEDFEPGRSFALGPRTVSSEEIVAFARAFDPQPMHLDEAAGRASMLGGLAASGWHTSALMMAMMAESYILASASEGAPGIEALNWRKPVLAGDTLSGRSTVTARRPSRSRAGIGIVSLKHALANQRGETVLTCTNACLVRMRAPDAGTSGGVSAGAPDGSR